MHHEGTWMPTFVSMEGEDGEVSIEPSRLIAVVPLRKGQGEGSVLLMDGGHAVTVKHEHADVLEVIARAYMQTIETLTDLQRQGSKQLELALVEGAATKQEG